MFHVSQSIHVSIVRWPFILCCTGCTDLLGRASGRTIRLCFTFMFLCKPSRGSRPTCLSPFAALGGLTRRTAHCISSIAHLVAVVEFKCRRVHSTGEAKSRLQGKLIHGTESLSHDRGKGRLLSTTLPLSLHTTTFTPGSATGQSYNQFTQYTHVLSMSNPAHWRRQHRAARLAPQAEQVCTRQAFGHGRFN